MADQPSFIVALKSNLPESSWPWVISALRQDPLIWIALQEPEFIEKTISNLAGKPESWTPAILASLVLDQPLHPDGPLRKTALQAYENRIRNGLPVDGDPNIKLADAGLLALALRIHLQHPNPWSDLVADLQSIPVENPAFFTFWSTPLAVLFGLVSDPQDMLQALVSPGNPISLYSLALHAVLSNPLTFARQEQILFSLLSELDLPSSTYLIRRLNVHRPGLAERLARKWLELHPPLPVSSTTCSPKIQIDLHNDHLFQAEMYTYAGQLDQAASLHSLVLRQVVNLQAEITNQLTDVLIAKGDYQVALNSWQQLGTRPEKAVPPDSLLFGLLENGRSEDVLKLLLPDDQISSQPSQQLASAYLAAQKGDLSTGRHAAHQALYTLEEQLDIPIDGQTLDQSSVFSNNQENRALVRLLKHLVILLLDLSSPAEAFRAARLAHALRPNDPETLNSLALTSRLAGDPAIAIQAAHLSVTLEPKDPERRRLLAGCLESAGEWSAALAERTALLDPRFASPRDISWPLSSDWHALAHCALQAGDPQCAIAACQNALIQNPEDGLAQTAYGEALVALGDDRQAIERFRLATQQSPHLAEPWLSLASTLQRDGQMEKAVETLTAASHAVPDDPKIHLALAEAYLNRNSLSQAETCLQLAHEIVTTSRPWKLEPGFNVNSFPADISPTWYRDLRCRIALLYGQTLTQLGRLNQARQVYASAYQAYPAFPDLAYAYARTLLDLGEPGEALTPLAVTLAAEPMDPAPYLDYANALLIVKKQPDEAVHALQKVLLISDKLAAGNNNPMGLIEIRTTAHALLAEALEASGQLEAALKAYSQALESSLSTDMNWHIRLSLGMSRVALRMGQPEIAIAALQDINSSERRDPQALQILSEAYTAINLPDEALQAARTAVELAPDDVAILTWFADQALVLGARKEAISALTRAVQLDPQRTNLLIHLGEVLAQSGDSEAALEVYCQVLQNPTAQSEHLYQIALQMLELGDVHHAIQSLERAIKQQNEPSSAFLRQLSSAYQQVGDPQRALETLDLAIQLEPDDPALHLLKAELLLLLDRPQAAQACLEHALNLHPHDATIYHRLATLLRSQGDLFSAYNHAQKMVDIFNPDDFSSDALKSRAFAADLARATLQPDEASRLLGTLPSLTGESLFLRELNPLFNEPQVADYFCIFAELALDQNEENLAAEALKIGYEISPEYPRIQGLEARLTYRRGDRTAALANLQMAISNVDEQASECIGLSLAALDLEQWDLAIELAQRGAESTPREPFSNLLVARGLVLRAEYQRFCEALQVMNHAPGPAALHEKSYQLFSTAIQSTLDCYLNKISATPSLLIRRWKARGQAVFHPDPNSLAELKDLKSDIADQAAYIAALSSSARIPDIEAIYKYWHARSGDAPLNHLFSAQYALAVGLNRQQETNLVGAIRAVQAAIEQLPNQPLYHALLARLAQAANDEETGLRAIQTAIGIWPDEPYWHALAAALYQSTGDLPSVINHLERAVDLDPQHFPHHFALGEAYLQAGKTTHAIHALKRASEIDHQRFEPYFSIAQAYYASNDLDNAARNADRAISLAPGQISPLLLRAEVALMVGDSGIAYDRSVKALRLNSEDPTALHLYGRVLEQLGRYNEALAAVDKAIPLTINPLPLLLERVQLITRIQGNNATLPALEELAEQYPDEPDVLTPLAFAQAEAGKHGEAILSTQHALRAGSKHLESNTRADLHHLLGNLLRQTGQLDQAIHQLSEVTRLAPDRLEPYLDLGSTQQDRRQHTLALQTYQKAIAVAPDDPRPYFHAAQSYKACRDYLEAENMLRRAADLAPEDITIHRQLGALVALNLIHNRRPVPLEV